jgi:hypothetical protein
LVNKRIEYKQQNWHISDFGEQQSFGRCGIKPSEEDKLYNAESSNDHPWHAALVDDERGFFCGGSLISNTAVVTGK